MPPKESWLTDILGVFSPKYDISPLFALSTWGVVLGPVSQITDSEADQTHNASAYRAIVGHSYSQGWLKVSERQYGAAGRSRDSWLQIPAPSLTSDLRQLNLSGPQFP